MLWKKALTSTVFQDANLWKVFTWCLLRANYMQKPLLLSGEEIQLERGQFLTGRISASEELRMSASMVYRSLKTLEKINAISVKSNNRFSVVTICNYESYQDFNYELEQPLNNKRTTDEQPLNTEKEVKEKKEGKENTYTSARPQNVEQVIEYGADIGLDHPECEAFFDHFTSNGWKVGGKTAMRDWKSALRNWKRNKDKFKGNSNAAPFGGNRQSDATRRATFRHTEQQIKDLEDFAETLRQRYPGRG